MLTLRFIIQFLGLIQLLSASEVVVLTSKNFEHLTQASTGATTGDWLVKFYAPWCGHCKTLAPTFDKVAEELKGVVNVAKVDVTENRDLGTRFDIKGFPTVKLLSKGKVYTFKGRRSAEELIQFAKGGYSLHEPEEVAPPMGMFGEIIHVYKHAYMKAGKDLKAGNYFTIDIFLTFLPVLFGIIIVFLIMLPKPDDEAMEKRYRKEHPQDNDDNAEPTHRAAPPTSETDNSHGKSE